MKTRASLFAALLGALALGASACGGDTECGPGTVELGDSCVPSQDACAEGTVYNPETDQCEGAACAPGTKLEGNECVPDGSVVCGDGSTYDVETGTCVSNVDECGEGTVEVDGECVTYDDSLVGDVEELPEPNADGAGVFDVPAVGENVTIKGCVTPTDANGDGVLDIDYDPYLFQTSGPILLDVTVDGLNGLAGGFIAIAADGDPALVAGWQRMGVNLVNDKARRQLYVPAAGVYALFITDARSVLTGEAAGGEDTCYFATIGQVAIPEPTPITGNEVAGVLGNDVLFYSYDAVDEGDVLLNTVEVASEAASAGIVARRNGAFDGSAPFAGPGSAGQLVVAGFAADDDVVLVVDPELNYALEPADFVFTVGDPGATALPEGSTSANLTRDPVYFTYAYFDAEAGDIIRFELNAGDAGTDGLVAGLGDEDTAVFGLLCPDTFFGCPGGLDEWVHITQSGRYYLVLDDTTVALGDPFALNVERTTETATPLELGAPSEQTLSDSLTNWYSVDLSGQIWVENATGTATLTDDLVYTWYEGTTAGVLGQDVAPITNGFLDGPDTSLGRIVYETDTPRVLVRVEDMAGSSAAGEVFDFGIQAREFVDLETINSNTQPSIESTNLVDGDVHRYFLRGLDFAEVGITIDTLSALGDVRIAQLGRDENVLSSANDGGEGEDEELTVTVRDGWVAFEVTEVPDATPAEYALSTTYEAPEDYVRTEGTLPFATVCPDGGGAGSEHAFVDDDPGDEIPANADDNISATPIDISGFGFLLFGEPVSEVTVSTNGWLTMSTGYAGASHYNPLPLPADDSVNAVVAPYWVDATDVTVCTYTEGDTLTIEWQGVTWAEGVPVQFQTVLHADGKIDFIYGGDHTDVGGTIGIEDILGARAELITTTAGKAAPGTSWTLDPN